MAIPDYLLRGKLQNEVQYMKWSHNLLELWKEHFEI